MEMKEVGNDKTGQGCPKNEMGRGSPRYGMDWPSKNAGQQRPKEGIS